MKIKTSLITFLICCLINQRVPGNFTIQLLHPVKNQILQTRLWTENQLTLYKPNLVANQQNKLDEFKEATRYLIKPGN